MALLVRLLWLLVICAASPCPADGMERAGDALLVRELQAREAAMDDLQTNILALIETSPDEERFDLYWTYNQLVGTWLQVDLSRALLERSISAVQPLEEEAIRTNLRDHARFALWDLDQARMQLERNVPDAGRAEHLRINEAVRSLLSDARTLISRLLADQCIHLQCVADT